ncbi:MAG: LL-diaminopimelate aminotransferase [Candidatus Omnitrophica bacterium]|nr:LL-diaminopimelate aminotransferase [Candidatus Omnitrophota bacterium]MCM8806952.1 LL-diaminopimelate aminotransferase [Candidatus Omnitrophota bacterium]
MFEISERLKKIPPYLFVEIDKKKKKLLEKGEDVIDFGVGDPDMPTPSNIIEAMKKAVENPKFHRYPFGKGTKEFRKAISDFYKKNYDVKIDPDEEICVLIGSKEGISHFPLCFINPGDVSLVPEPGYPVYSIGTLIAGGESYFLPLKEENDFLPDLGKIPDEIVRKAKILYLNYPNNPTGSFANKDFLKDVINFCKKNKIILAYDAAYSEIYFEEKPVNIFSIEGAKEVTIEFNSLSKTYNMTGWRIGWACGNSFLISSLAKIKENIDSGTFEAIQFAGIEALTGSQDSVAKMREIYKKRRDLFADGIKKLGFEFSLPKGTFYFWVKIKENSIKFVDFLLENGKIVATPGVGFGPSGEGYVRFSLTINESKIKEAIERMKKIWAK